MAVDSTACRARPFLGGSGGHAPPQKNGGNDLFQVVSGGFWHVNSKS